MNRLIWDKCCGCSWEGEIDWEVRMCPECEMELLGWSKRRGKQPIETREGLNYKHLLEKRGIECEDC